MLGLPGALIATVAICLPPLGVLLVDRLHTYIGDHPATRGFVRGLGLTVVGIFLVVLARLLIDNGIDVYALLIVAGSLALALTRRLPVIVILVIAGLAGLALY
jgi:chromate transport protein ChrA